MTEKIYIHHSRAKKVSDFLKKVKRYRTAVKTNYMQDTTTASHSSNAKASSSEKCGFVEEMKANAAGGLKIEQITGTLLCKKTKQK